MLTLVVAPPARGQGLSHQWSQGFGDVDDEGGYDIAVDSAGNVLVTGFFEGPVDFGGGSITSAGSFDIFVAKFDSAGTHVWSQGFGGVGLDNGFAIGTDGAGNVLVTGDFSGTVDFGGGPITSAGAGDIFIAKFDAAGSHLWSQGFGGTSSLGDFGSGIAVDGAGNVVVTGSFRGTVDFGGGPITTAGSGDIFVAKFDSAGTHIWSQGFGDVQYDFGGGIAVDGAGNVLVTGTFRDTVDFGGGLITSAGLNDIFVAKFDAGGAHLWSQRFGESGGDSGLGIAADGTGNVLVTGAFRGTVDFGGGPLTSTGVSDIFVAKFDPGGAHLWSQGFGESQNDWSRGIAADRTGNVLLTGSFQGTVDFGGGPITSEPTSDIFVAKFDPAGGHLWSQGFGGNFVDRGSGIAVDAAGDVHVTGQFWNTVDFGGGPITSAGVIDMFIAKFELAALPCAQDVNGDGTINVLDLIDLLLCFGLPAVPGCVAEDINEDGTVNVLDLIDLLLEFGQACP